MNIGNKMEEEKKKGRLNGIIQAMGLVFGDIGTSPIYTFTVIFLTLPITLNNILSILSLVVWTFVGTSLNHSLVNQLFVGFIFANDVDVKEEFIPKAGINQVSGSVFGPPDVQVHILPIFIFLFRNQFVRIMRVHISQIIAAGACKSGHGATFQRISLFCFPIFGACQWRFAGLRWQIFIDFGK